MKFFSVTDAPARRYLSFTFIVGLFNGSMDPVKENFIDRAFIVQTPQTPFYCSINIAGVRGDVGYVVSSQQETLGFDTHKR